MRKSRFLLVILFVIVIAGSSFFLLKNTQGQKEEVEVIPPDTFEVIDEAYTIIQNEGIHPVEGRALIEGALRGMADVIEDPYSTYLSEEEAAAHRESLASERIGIGAEITRANGKFLIVAPLKSSPADKAGLRPYDEIIRIDGENIAGSSLQEVVKKIRGKQGTTLNMTIYRPEMNKHLEVSIVRDAIPVATVSNEVLEEKKRKVGYISITTFGEETAGEWKVATDAVLGGRAEALIIDVRGNPGGYLHSVSQIVSSLLEEDTVFAYMEDPRGALTPLLAENSEEIQYSDKLKKIPVVLLQDKGSASASEVLSGALRDSKRSMIIGTESFGKGTVQDTFDLSNGGEVKLSTHKWLTPKEKWIHGKGIPVHLEVKQDGLYNEHIRLVAVDYKEGDYHDDIAYAQRLLAGLGYKVKKADGYFDKETVSAVLAFKKDKELEVNGKMNREFYMALKEEVEVFRADKENDKQLQMALDYLMHELKEK
ncbi:S41 family peptidase [Sporosarcina pasteurii]|uniref:Carboxy-terminal processing protease CtpB n=1 Tax=Sporosarcina pasteurii TaxID=1474 RepID=A0A380BFW6_SPOPA|nr:S41 family peptidase [Sporosarcina pasteurii]MDS9470346.1 S41 family peptidase [Sporosarcina pasteurii]QBQ05944.1 PDZ domain-containing protein [Sporosarcina pasteurii]SUI99846.1 Carboxy-terminal processing protease CtpB precursor [Sporosarcina pasteurii]